MHHLKIVQGTRLVKAIIALEESPTHRKHNTVNVYRVNIGDCAKRKFTKCGQTALSSVR